MGLVSVSHHVLENLLQGMPVVHLNSIHPRGFELISTRLDESVNILGHMVDLDGHPAHTSDHV